MAKARSISAAKLSSLTKAAVRSATGDVSGRFIGRGPTMGFILQGSLSSSAQLKLASQITDSVTANARSAGISGLRPQPVVVLRPDRIILGFIAPELGITIR